MLAAIDNTEIYSTSALSSYHEELKERYVFEMPKRTNSNSHSIVTFPINIESKSASLPSQQYSYQYAVLARSNPWIVDFFSDATKINTPREILPYYKRINILLSKEEYSLCNTFLSYVEPRELSDILIVGLLRLTSSWKHELPSWKRLLAKSSEELKSRNKDYKHILNGLI